MKNNFLKLSAILCILLFAGVPTVNAQWQPEVRLTNDTSHSFTSNNNAWSIAAAGGNLHAVWFDKRDGNNEIYYKRSTNSGANWDSDVRLTFNNGISNDPSIAVSGSLVHIVWCETRDGNIEVYYKRSPDGGVSWGTDRRLTADSSASEKPSIAAAGSSVHIVWFDRRDGNREIYYKRSTDGGLNWGPDVRMTNSSGFSYSPTIAVNGSNIHVLWYDNRDGNHEIYYKRSANGGGNWGADTRLTNNSAASYNPCAALSGSNVHVVWHDNRDGNSEIYYKRSTDGGGSWGADIRCTANDSASTNPSIAVSGSALHILWCDERFGRDEVLYLRSTDQGISWETAARLTNNSSTSERASIAISGSAIHIIWTEQLDGNPEIFYKQNPTGNPFGIKKISSEIPLTYSLYQNYPNPFNPITNIRFEVPENSFLNLKVCDILGREITELVNEELIPGNYEVEFNAVNCTSGIYFYIMKTDKYTETKKMIIVK